MFHIDLRREYNIRQMLRGPQRLAILFFCDINDINMCSDKVNANIGQSIMNKRISDWSPSGTKCQVPVFVSSVDFFLDTCVTKGTLPHFYKYLSLLYGTRFSLSSLRMRKRAVLTSGTYFREQQVLVQFSPHFAPTRHWYH